jgi:hypothetical protein
MLRRYVSCAGVRRPMGGHGAASTQRAPEAEGRSSPGFGSCCPRWDHLVGGEGGSDIAYNAPIPGQDGRPCPASSPKNLNRRCGPTMRVRRNGTVACLPHSNSTR